MNHPSLIEASVKFLSAFGGDIPDWLRAEASILDGAIHRAKNNIDGGLLGFDFFDSLPWQHSMGDDEDALICTVELAGVPFHCWALKVEEINNIQRPVRDPHRRFSELGQLCGESGTFRTTQIKGFPGDWVVWFEPFTR